MRLESLVHLAGVALAISPGRRIVILGSSALLGSHPDLGEPNGPLEASFDADFLIEGGDEQLAKIIEEAIGKGSLFEAKEGYHADTLRPVVAETFPRGWEKRLVPLPGFDAVGCLDPHDLAAVKLQAGRTKDLQLCATLLAMGKLDEDSIRDRLDKTRMSERMITLTTERLKKITEMAKKRGS